MSRSWRRCRRGGGNAAIQTLGVYLLVVGRRGRIPAHGVPVEGRRRRVDAPCDRLREGRRREGRGRGHRLGAPRPEEAENERLTRRRSVSASGVSGLGSRERGLSSASGPTPVNASKGARTKHQTGESRGRARGRNPSPPQILAVTVDDPARKSGDLPPGSCLPAHGRAEEAPPCQVLHCRCW